MPTFCEAAIFGEGAGHGLKWIKKPTTLENQVFMMYQLCIYSLKDLFTMRIFKILFILALIRNIVHAFFQRFV